ncbi:oligosaccharyl transferase stt3 subunit [Brettanomyces nanus]|uniref:dolichyl-diphosphooligosaccharide--protein glycotransferase n=1 Tax=Eeniella nana TaxID=13502 RepID=A0A875RYD5_EENNA|nr:oligosaccharyl transferase stt3 subunit [Brettanomyces nanus]QPG77277.1 oligosaccharyl transferase stt3 subunit [Brettanomyces nanus]
MLYSVDKEGYVRVDSSLLVAFKLLLETAIFVSISFAAISSRLFSVIRFESIIHEFDPWFNFRATKYLVSHSFYQFLNWFDDKTWYPLGRVTGGTLYPGLMVTSSVLYHFLHKIGLPIDVRNICVLLAPAFSSITSLATFLLTWEISDTVKGLRYRKTSAFFAAFFMSIVPGYISRSVAGSYDNEAIAITLLMVTFYLWIKSVRLGSVFYASLTAITYFYMVSAWGGYVFITNMIPLHVFILLLMGRFNYKLYTSYCTWYVLGTVMSMQIPFVGFLPIRSNDHMSALGVFGLLQFVLVANYLKRILSPEKFHRLMIASGSIVLTLGIAGLVLATKIGIIAPWTGRFYSLWDTSYAKIHIPIIASVSEHQPTPWASFFFDMNFLVWLFPVGVFICFQDLSDEAVFIIVYSVLASYFSGVMIRLILTLSPVVCVCGGLTVGKLCSIYMDFKDIFNSKAQKVSGAIFDTFSKLLVTSSLIFYLYYYVYHCTWVTSNAYSSPSVVLASRNPDGSSTIIDDFREAYYWLRMNTADDSKVMAWWDYGYQIGGMADRTTFVDNNTWNNTHIATVGKAMAVDERQSEVIMRRLGVDYVLVIFGGVLGYSGDDINKFLWMVRISEGIWPDEVSERNYFTPGGAYRVDDLATPAMKNSLMYKMSYYRFGDLFQGRDAMDRVRQQRLSAQYAEHINLDVLEEVFTSENWIVRIYKLKDQDTFGRDLIDLGEQKRHQLGKKALRKKTRSKPELDIRI